MTTRSERLRAVALERARRERGDQPPPRRLKSQRVEGSKGLDLDKLARGPEWSGKDMRERIAIDTLHAAYRYCGRELCPTCKERGLRPQEMP